MGGVVLPEEGEEREIATRRHAHSRRSARAPEQDEGAEHRQVVGRQDACRATEGVEAEVHRRSAAQRGAGEAAVQQVARQHEEEDQTEPEVGQHIIEDAGAPDPGGIGKAVQPYVEAHNR